MRKAEALQASPCLQLVLSYLYVARGWHSGRRLRISGLNLLDGLDWGPTCT